MLGLVALFWAIGPVETLGAAVQRARWYELYDDARQDVSRGRWAEAEQKLLAAQKDGPRPGRTVLRYGTWRDDYFPDYYLALVYLNTNRPKEAIARFQAARTQGLNLGDNEFNQFETQLARAQTAADDLAAQTKRAELQPVAPSPPAPPPSPTPPREARKVDTPDKPPSQTEPPVPAAPTPAQQLEPLIGRARTQLAARNFSDALATLAAARKIDSAAPIIGQLEREVRRAAAADAVDTAVAARNTAAADRALAALEALDPSWPTTAALRQKVRGLRTAVQRLEGERSAMLAFFAGDYDRALELLGGTERATSLSGRGLFYRACSLAALALLATPVD
jgi:hypothetical protein